MKTHTTLTVEPQLMAEARKRGINVSAILTDALKASMSLEIVEDAVYAQLCDRIREIEKTQKELSAELRLLVSQKVAYEDRERRMDAEEDAQIIAMDQAHKNAGTLERMGA